MTLTINDTHHNDTQHIDTQPNETHLDDAEHNDTQHTVTQYTDVQHNDNLSPKNVLPLFFAAAVTEPGNTITILLHLEKVFTASK
jgi:hypothetical protein